VNSAVATDVNVHEVYRAEVINKRSTGVSRLKEACGWWVPLLKHIRQGKDALSQATLARIFSARRPGKADGR